MLKLLLSSMFSKDTVSKIHPSLLSQSSSYSEQLTPKDVDKARDQRSLRCSNAGRNGEASIKGSDGKSYLTQRVSYCYTKGSGRRLPPWALGESLVGVTTEAKSGPGAVDGCQRADPGCSLQSR